MIPSGSCLKRARLLFHLTPVTLQPPPSKPAAAPAPPATPARLPPSTSPPPAPPSTPHHDLDPCARSPLPRIPADDLDGGGAGAQGAEEEGVGRAFGREDAAVVDENARPERTEQFED